MICPAVPFRASDKFGTSRGQNLLLFISIHMLVIFPVVDYTLSQWDFSFRSQHKVVHCSSNYVQLQLCNRLFFSLKTEENV